MTTETFTSVAERDLDTGEAHAHIENPTRPGIALCLTPIGTTRTTGGDCPTCAQLVHENRTWIAR